MPDGFEGNVDVYTWGAGGGAGSGAAGGGGGYAYSNLAIPSGSTVSVIVGNKGGDASGPNPGSAGTGASIGFNGGAGAYQGDPEDGDAGGSGGGGAATALIINGNVSVVAAGGGGGGGYGEDGAGGATVGLPGGIYVGHDTGIYPVTLSYAWCAFMNSYAVWGGGQDYTVTLNFPTTGTYTFNYSVDNYGQVYLDGSSIISYSTFTTYTTYTQTVSAGNHTVRVTGVNTGGPAGVALQILKPDASELWNTRALIVSDGLTSTTNGQDGTRGGAGGAGGGGGGFRGGETGVAYGDDGPGGQGGNGGLNLGDTIIAGTDTISGGASQRSVLGLPPSTGDAGYDGYAILSFTRKMRMFNKVAGNWKSIEKIYYKATQAGTLSNVLTKTFSTIGSSPETWTVPTGVKQLTVSYPTPDGMAIKLFPVTAGETVSIKLGDFGVDSTITGSAGTLTLPAYDKRVFTYAGNVDHIIAQNVQVVTPTPASYSGSGSNATIEAGAAAAGITYTVTYEGWHGDLGASITITPALQSTIFQPLQVYVKNGSGRQYPSAHTYQQQPDSTNGYIMNDYQGDYYGGEGSYSWETWMYQQGYISITYDQAYAPGTWIPISKVYYKDGDWKPLTSSTTINLTKLS